jgi:polo-like kinase 1
VSLYSLKLGNLFLTDTMQIKVGDFGLATHVSFEGERKRTICGTPNYIAPEILDSQKGGIPGLNQGGHSYEVDYWSIGVILYTLLVGRPPFESSEVKHTYKKIKACAYSFPDNIEISRQAKDFIRGVLKLEPHMRLNLQGMLQHDFLTMNKVPELLPTSTLAC